MGECHNPTVGVVYEYAEHSLASCGASCIELASQRTFDRVVVI